jgi:hypothetical protein
MRNVLFLLACCVLSGCAASSRYEAKRLDDTLIDPKRILIIESSGRDDKGNMDLFHAAIVDGFRKCSVESDYVHIDLRRPTLSLENYEGEDHKAIADVSERLHPDYLLTLRETDLIDITPYNFKLELIDAATKHTVWNGSVKLESHGVLTSGPDVGTVLATSLIQTLRDSSLLKSCTAPTGGTP